jgi:hypothetical protein
MNKGRVGEERGGKETDGCPLTVGWSEVAGTGLGWSEVSIGGMVVGMSLSSSVVWTCRVGAVIEGWLVREQGVVEMVGLREVVRHLGVGGVWS